MKRCKSERNVCLPIRYNVKDFSTSLSFSEDDVEHCFNCLSFAEYLLDVDSEADSVPFSLTSNDVKYLSRLLYRAYHLMRDVIEASASGGSDDDI